MLDYVLNTSTNVLYQCCPRREGLRHGAVLRRICNAPGRRPPPCWIGRGQINKGIMLGELRVLLFLCFRIVLDWMGMDVRVNVFAVPFLCADSVPWRKMSMA